MAHSDLHATEPKNMGLSQQGASCLEYIANKKREIPVLRSYQLNVRERLKRWGSEVVINQFSGF